MPAIEEIIRDKKIATGLIDIVDLQIVLKFRDKTYLMQTLKNDFMEL